MKTQQKKTRGKQDRGARSNRYPHDPVFFVKEQVGVGTVFNHRGRRDPDARWRVVGIQTHTGAGVDRRGLPRTKFVQVVEKFGDLVALVRDGGPAEGRLAGEKILRFGYLSYSAVWAISSRGRR